MNMEWLSIAIAILYIYNLIFDSISYFKTVYSDNDKQQKSLKQKASAENRIIDVIVFALSVLLFLLLIACSVWTDIFPKAIVIPLIAFFGFIFYVNNFVKASESIKSIILGGDTDQNLSVKEKFNFDIISGTILVIYSYFISGKIERIILGLSLSHTVTEALISVYSAIVMFGLSFSIIIQLILPIKHIKEISEYVSNKTKLNKSTKAFYYGHYANAIIKANFTNRVLDSTSKRKILTKIFVFLLILPCAFIIDVIIGFFLCLFWYGICGVIIILCEFLSFIGKGFLYLVSMLSKSPERRVVKNTFRLSFIISIILVVIINRYELIYVYDEKFLTVFEFIASTIVIPIIFEWIYSNDKNKENMQIQTSIASHINGINTGKNNNQKKTKHKYKRNRKD